MVVCADASVVEEERRGSLGAVRTKRIKANEWRLQCEWDDRRWLFQVALAARFWLLEVVP